MISGTLVLAVDTHCTGNTGTGLHRQEIAGSWHPRNLYMAASASVMHRFALSAHFAISLGFEQHWVELIAQPDDLSDIDIWISMSIIYYILYFDTQMT